MGSRRKYSQDFKQEAVQLSRQAGVSVSQVARDVGITPNMLTRWRREFAAAGRRHSVARALPGTRNWRSRVVNSGV